MKYVLWFNEINKDMVKEVGGKAANLGEMANAGFPIPNGFVVTAFAYETSLKKAGILKKIEEIERNINVNDVNELNDKSKEIKDLILKAKMDKDVEEAIRNAYKKLGNVFVAVRSSATAEDLPTASFAGQQDTYLNKKGIEDVIFAVKKCWASLFNSRAIFYRRKQGFPIEKVKIAVVVQKMVESEVSGIMFTANPTTNALDEIVIEAGYGLGEAIVSGSITPDTYVVSKDHFKILEKHISTQTWMYVRGKDGNKKVNVPKEKQSVQKLADNYIVELAKIGKRIEDHYGWPQDIEWALEAEELYIVQSRPVTTIKKKEEEVGLLEEKVKPVLEGLGASAGFASGPVKIVLKMEELDKVKKGDILVTTMTTPDMVPAMKKAAAIITDEGGITSHAAIVSRELGIPAVVGTNFATAILKDNEIVTVDAYRGKVYLGEVKHREKVKKEVKEKGIVPEFLTATKVKVNVAFPEAAKKAAETGADGIGLLRAEHLITATGKHPAWYIRNKKEKELKEALKEELRKILIYFKHKPVYYRTFDARTDEFRHLKGGKDEPIEANPMLGWHGIRRDLDQPALLKVQLRAIKELIDEGFENIGIMIPFTQHVDEYKKAKEIAMEIGLRPHKDCFFGIMVETPAAALTIDDYIAAGLDFISFGTNDLTQLTLGIDRNNERIQKWFDEMHPAVLKQISHVIKKCRKAGVRTSICGQAGSRPEMVRFLVSVGIDSVSANIDAVRKIKKVVYETERELILKEIKERNLEKIEEI